MNGGDSINNLDAPVAYFSIPAVQGSVQFVMTATLAKVTGGYQATVMVKNNGGGTAKNVVLSAATLGAATGSPLPYALGDIQPGSSAAASFFFPSSAGASGAAVVEKYTGAYQGGTFASSIRAVLPSN
jgi:hypothetical protein